MTYILGYVIVLIIAVIFGSIIFAALIINKKRINKQLKEEQENILNGDIPKKKVKDNSETYLMIIKMFLLIECIVSITITIYSNTSLTNNNINGLYSKINQLENKIESLEDDIEEYYQKNNQLLSLFEVTYVENSFDPKTMDAEMLISLCPKEIGDDTTVSLIVDDISYIGIKNNNKYEISYRRNVFNYDHSEIFLNITTNGITKTEYLRKSDYDNVHLLYSPFYHNYIPHVYYVDYEDDNNSFNFNKGKVIYDCTMEIYLEDDLSNLKKLTLFIYDGDKVIYEKDYTNDLVQSDNDYYIKNIKLKESFNIESNYCDLVWETIDENGFTSRKHDRIYKENTGELSLYISISNSDGEEIYSGR